MGIGPMLCAPTPEVIFVHPVALGWPTLAGTGRIAHAWADRSPGSLRRGQGYGIDDLGAARQAAGPACDLPTGTEHEHGRGPPDVELPGEVGARGHVDLDVRYAFAAAGNVGKQLPRRAARSGGGRGALEQGGPARPGEARGRPGLDAARRQPVARMSA